MDHANVINSLMLLAQGDTAEAENAKRHAQRLMKQYNITDDKVLDYLVKKEMTQVTLKTRFRKTPEWCYELARAVAKVFSARLLLDWEEAPKTDWRPTKLASYVGVGRDEALEAFRERAMQLAAHHGVFKIGDVCFIKSKEPNLPLTVAAYEDEDDDEGLTFETCESFYFSGICIRGIAPGIILGEGGAKWSAYRHARVLRKFDFLCSKGDVDLVSNVYSQLEAKLYSMGSKMARIRDYHGHGIVRYRNSFIKGALYRIGSAAGNDEAREKMAERYRDIKYPKLGTFTGGSVAQPSTGGLVDGGKANVPINWPMDRLLPASTS